MICRYVFHDETLWTGDALPPVGAYVRLNIDGVVTLYRVQSVLVEGSWQQGVGETASYAANLRLLHHPAEWGNQ